MPPSSTSIDFVNTRSVSWTAGSSGLLMDYCPFCGQRLPESLRDAWFDRLDELGLEPEDDEIPAEHAERALVEES